LAGTKNAPPKVGQRAAFSSVLGSREDNAASNLSKPRNSNFISEESCPLDADGEDDWTFFRARPYERSRIRSAFPGEFSRKILKQGRGRQAVVIVAIDRDPVTGEPRTRGRGILFVEGGRA